MKRLLAVTVCLLGVLLPGYGALAQQQDGEVLKILQTRENINIVIPQWEPIPIESEEIIIMDKPILGTEGKTIIISEEERQIREEKKQGEIELVAQMIQCEAGNQPYDGKVAVGNVLWNRKDDPRFSNTIEGVITEPGAFSCLADGRFYKAGWKVTEESYAAAKESYENHSGSEVLYFRTKNYHGFGTPVCQIGDHYFSK